MQRFVKTKPGSVPKPAVPLPPAKKDEDSDSDEMELERPTKIVKGGGNEKSSVDAAKTEAADVSGKGTAENLPWVEKYRPKQLDDVISHDQIVKTIRKLIDERKLPHLLFYGPPGTGKTSTILACARYLYGNNFQSMVLELNASDDRGIDVVREQIKDFASTRKIFSSGVKLIILDEADSMTSAAQNALRRVIEKYTRNTRFCLIGNYINKIIPALQSRCTRFRFAPLQKEMVLPRLQHVIASEGIKVTPEAVEAILRLSGGDMRKCLNILQSASMSFGDVDEQSIYLCTGNPEPKDVHQIVQWLLQEDYAAAYNNVQELRRLKGIALIDVVKEIHPYIDRIDFPTETKIQLLDMLAEIEHRLSQGATEKMQLGALVGVFQEAREQTAGGMEVAA